jgi:hypothetical protein
MNTTVDPQPGLFLRILQYPLTRLILLGGLMLVLYGLAGGFIQKFADSPPKTLATIIGPDVLTDGSFGLESSLIAFLLCTTTGVVLLIMAIRRGNIVPTIWKRKA